MSAFNMGKIQGNKSKLYSRVKIFFIIESSFIPFPYNALSLIIILYSTYTNRYNNIILRRIVSCGVLIWKEKIIYDLSNLILNLYTRYEILLLPMKILFLPTKLLRVLWKVIKGKWCDYPGQIRLVRTIIWSFWPLTFLTTWLHISFILTDSNIRKWGNKN